MTENVETLTPSLLLRTPPPEHTKVDWDIIIYGPLRTPDIEGFRRLYEVLSLNEEHLRSLKQVAFCTDASVAYLSACHTRVCSIPPYITSLTTIQSITIGQ